MEITMASRSIPIITVFDASPDRGRGLARDMRVRWALEEVAQAYEVRPVSFAALKEPDHRAIHPFGQIPTYEEGDLALFESGAIVLHLAQRHAGLLPQDADARARAIMWMFAALSTIEPVLVDREILILLERGEPWFDQRRDSIEARIRSRLSDLSRHLGAADWLDGTFSAGDLMMVDVLRRLRGVALLAEHPNLADYVARAEARPAFQRAFKAQRDLFEATSGAGDRRSGWNALTDPET
jgi:glutathione S-transferase